MSAGVLYELNGLLAEQVDAFAAVLEQRDLARDLAVQLEQQCARYEQAFTEDQCPACDGSGGQFSGVEYAGTREVVGCDECEGTGVGIGGAYAEIRRLRDEFSRLAAVGATGEGEK
jgi:hypothetical protein